MNRELLVGCVPPRRSAQDGASDEELMLPLENRGVNVNSTAVTVTSGRLDGVEWQRLMRKEPLSATIEHAPLRPHALVTARSRPAGRRSRGSTRAVVLSTPARRPGKPRPSRPKPPRDEEAEQLLRLCREGRLFELQAWVAAGKSVSWTSPPVDLLRVPCRMSTTGLPTEGLMRGLRTKWTSGVMHQAVGSGMTGVRPPLAQSKLPRWRPNGMRIEKNSHSITTLADSGMVCPTETTGARDPRPQRV